MARRNFQLSTINDGTDNQHSEDSEFDQATDHWDSWLQVHADRDTRLKLLCRQPDEKKPVASRTILVRMLPLSATRDQVTSMFRKAGNIRSIYFPKVGAHFTTKYCFITFQTVRQAELAKCLFDLISFGGECLQVIEYDSAYKHSCRNNTQSIPNASNDDGADNIVSDMVRQAEVQSQTRASRRNKTVTLPDGFVQQQQDAETGSGWNDDTISDTKFSCSTDNSHEDECCYNPEKDAKDNAYFLHKCNTIDEMLLDSEEGFLNWLEGRLKFTGPIPYMDEEIRRALMKTPTSVKRIFGWLLGAFRCMNDGKRFSLVGPFICLPEQIWCAADKCVATNHKPEEWYAENWEPVLPNAIDSTKLLQRYLCAMLSRFGPLATNDLKLRYLINLLPPDVSWSENDSRILRVEELMQLVYKMTKIRIVDSILFSIHDHYELLLLKTNVQF